jgi:hypothetical protein
MLIFNNYFCKNRKSKLHFGDRVAVLNVFLYQTGGSTSFSLTILTPAQSTHDRRTTSTTNLRYKIVTRSPLDTCLLWLSGPVSRMVRKGAPPSASHIYTRMPVWSTHFFAVRYSDHRRSRPPKRQLHRWLSHIYGVREIQIYDHSTIDHHIQNHELQFLFQLYFNLCTYSTRILSGISLLLKRMKLRLKLRRAFFRGSAFRSAPRPPPVCLPSRANPS